MLKSSVQIVRAGGAKLMLIIIVLYCIDAVLLSPLIGWLFRAALRINQIEAIDLSALQLGAATPVMLALILALCVAIFWVAVAQFVLVMNAIFTLQDGGQLRFQELVTPFKSLSRKAFRPSSFPVFLYIFFMLPLTGFGFTSLFAQSISIPTFISGELFKSYGTAIGFTVFMAILCYLNLRFALTLPVFARTSLTGGKSLTTSWRLTRGKTQFRIFGTAALLLLIASLGTTLLILLALAPTALADTLAPQAAPVVAAISLGIASALAGLIVSLTIALLAGVLVSVPTLQRLLAAQPAPVADPLVPLSQEPVSSSRTPNQPQTTFSRTPQHVLLAILTLSAVAISAGSVNLMRTIANTPETLILGHRGFTEQGVENSFSGLDAAKAAGADYVEMDVMQTKDGQFVAMHDSSLSRLADKDVFVKDLTLDELVGTPIHTLAGLTDTIPSFSDYVQYAESIQLPLLIEIKLSGAETPDHVELLVAELEAIHSLENHIYHSLDPVSVERLKAIRPELHVGYTMAFAGVNVPDTPADFIVVEEWSATDSLQQQAAAAGLGFMAWTVNDEAGMRELLRRNVDGIITDHPDKALSIRNEMQDETGLAGQLFDMLQRFVVIF